MIVEDLTGDESARRLEVGGEVLTVAVDPDGERLVAAGPEGRVLVFDLRTGERLASFAVSGAPWIHQVAFHLTDGTIAVAIEVDPVSGSGEDDVEVWDPVTGDAIGERIDVLHQTPLALAWAPDGQEIAVVFDNNLMRFYDAEAQHQEVGEPIEVVDSPIMSAYAPDGGRLATGESSGFTRQWSAETHEQIGAALEGQTVPPPALPTAPTVRCSPPPRWASARSPTPSAPGVAVFWRPRAVWSIRDRNRIHLDRWSHSSSNGSKLLSCSR